MKQKKKTLITWLGMTDGRVAIGTERGNGLGPIASIVCEADIKFDNVTILYDLARRKEKDEFIKYIKRFIQKDEMITISSKPINIKHPNDFLTVYEYVERILVDIKNNLDEEFYINISSGSPAMAVCWFVCTERMKLNDRIIFLETSKFRGTQVINLPETTLV
jgi:sigma54-dependent transcription regulator